MTSDVRLTQLGVASARWVEDGMLVGLGTGSTAEAMINALGQRVKEGLLFTAVATSNRTAEQAASLGIALKELSEVNRLDLCIDGADEIDSGLNLVKGRGGALLFEKLVARRAKRYLIIATDEKLVERLGTRLPLPVEIVPTGWVHTAQSIRELGMSPELRSRADGSPYITDGGHYIVDCIWPTENAEDPGSLAVALKGLTGVVDHGLFIGMASSALTVDADGTITEHTAH